MAILSDFYKINASDINDTWTLKTNNATDYSDTTGFTVVNNVAELQTALGNSNYSVYLNDGTYDFTTINQLAFPVGQTIHLRGQSQNVILTTTTGDGTDGLLIQGDSTTYPNITVTMSAPSTQSDYVLTGDFQAQGVTAGDYVEFMTNANGDQESYRLWRINAVDATTATLDERTPCSTDAADTLTVVQAENVNVGQFTMENLTIQSNPVSYDYVLSQSNGGYVMNGTINDCKFTCMNGSRYAINRDNFNNWTINRCTMDRNDNIGDGVEYPMGALFIDCYFDRVHVNYGGEGFEWDNCYFYNVDVFEDGGLFTGCYFEDTTPAQLYLQSPTDSNYNFTNQSGSHFINVDTYEKNVFLNTTNFQVVSVPATNPSTIGVNGCWKLVSVTVIEDATGVVKLPPQDPMVGNVDYRFFNGTTIFRYYGTTIPASTCYFTIQLFA